MLTKTELSLLLDPILVLLDLRPWEELCPRIEHYRMALRLPRHLRITGANDVVRGSPALKRASAAIPFNSDMGTSTLNACVSSGNSSYVHNHAANGLRMDHQTNSSLISLVSSSAVGQLSSVSSAISLGKTFHTSSTVTQESAAAARETQTVEVNQPPSSTQEEILKISDRCVEVSGIDTQHVLI